MKEFTGLPLTRSPPMTLQGHVVPIVGPETLDGKLLAREGAMRTTSRATPTASQREVRGRKGPGYDPCLLNKIPLLVPPDSLMVFWPIV